MRILIADTFPDPGRAELSERGHDVLYLPTTTAEQLVDHIRGCDVLIVRSTRVTAATLATADTLRLVIRGGSGTNTIDCAAATDRGISVCNVPGRNAVAVAELAFALLLALDRNVPDNVADLRAGRWNKARYTKARGILGRRIGVVGLGQVGLAFAERATAFGATVFAVRKAGREPQVFERAHAMGIVFVDSLDTLAQTCDVLSFHVPATETTRCLVNSDLLAMVAPGTIVLNTSRGEIVDEDALIEAMDTKGVRAGLDVFGSEPAQGAGTIDSRLARHPNVYGTHHIGASTEQAQLAIAAEVVRMVDAFDAGAVLHCVNPDASPELVASTGPGWGS